MDLITIVCRTRAAGPSPQYRSAALVACCERKTQVAYTRKKVLYTPLRVSLGKKGSLSSCFSASSLSDVCCRNDLFVESVYTLKGFITPCQGFPLDHSIYHRVIHQLSESAVIHPLSLKPRKFDQTPPLSLSLSLSLERERERDAVRFARKPSPLSAVPREWGSSSRSRTESSPRKEELPRNEGPR